MVYCTWSPTSCMCATKPDPTPTLKNPTNIQPYLRIALQLPVRWWDYSFKSVLVAETSSFWSYALTRRPLATIRSVQSIKLRHARQLEQMSLNCEENIQLEITFDTTMDRLTGKSLSTFSPTAGNCFNGEVNFVRTRLCPKPTWL